MVILWYHKVVFGKWGVKMNIYKRQMNDLGLNIEEYSRMLDIPKLVTEKMVNGNGEVVDNMEINTS